MLCHGQELPDVRWDIILGNDRAITDQDYLERLERAAPMITSTRVRNDVNGIRSHAWRVSEGKITTSLVAAHMIGAFPHYSTWKPLAEDTWRFSKALFTQSYEQTDFKQGCAVPLPSRQQIHYRKHRLATNLASSRNLSRVLLSTVSLHVFTATYALVVLSRALYTVPKLPWPNLSSISRSSWLNCHLSLKGLQSARSLRYKFQHFDFWW